MDPVKADESGSPSLYFMTKDNQEELVKNNDIKEVEVNEKQACKEKCGVSELLVKSFCKINILTMHQSDDARIVSKPE